MLISIEMPFFGILTFLTKIESKKKSFNFQHFGFYEQMKFHAQFISAEHDKSFITSGLDQLFRFGKQTYP